LRLLRFPFRSHQSLWYDEVFTRTIVGRHSLGAMWGQIRQTESTPPLYYLIAKLSSDVLGTRSTVTLRAPSAVALTAAVPVSFLAFRDLIGRRLSLAAAALVAVNPLLVNYATDARSYALLVLTVLLSIWAC
jgi:mannosyltransferase